MPVQRERCDCCNRVQNQCPECGSNFVTPQEHMGKASPNDIVDYGITDGHDEDGPYTFVHVCWECGWEETVTITVERT